MHFRGLNFSDRELVDSKATIDTLPYPCANLRLCHLHEFEQKNPALDAPISTATWFHGDARCAASILRSRVKDLVQLNPWLQGSLVEDKSKSRMSLRFEEGVVSAEYNVSKNFSFIDSTHNHVYAPEFYLGMDLCTMTVVASKHGYICKSTYDMVKYGAPVFKVTLVTDTLKPKERFAVIVSMSHRIGDGFTFYAIYNMLSSSKPMVPLNPARKLDVVCDIEKAMNKKMLDGIFGLWIKALFLLSIIMAYLRSDKWSQSIFLLNHKFLEEQKRNEKSNTPVSTNDIIVSNTFKLTNCDVGLMTINFRGRITNCSPHDAGNYFNTIIYRRRDYETPSLIRKSLSGAIFERAAMPKTRLIQNTPLCLLKRFHACICTNWSTFNEENFILTGARQILHTPLKDMRYAGPSLISNCTIFKPWNGEIAVLVTGTPALLSAFSKSSLVRHSSHSEISDSDATVYFR